VFIEHATIGGALVAQAPAFFGMCETTAQGGVSVQQATGFVLLGDPTDDACGGNTIKGGVVLQDNQSGVEVAANHIVGALVVSHTSGVGLFPDDRSAEVEGNVINGGLVCSNNQPPPTNDGQPNSVTGSRAGQCLGL
jgi:hypothetical protein